MTLVLAGLLPLAVTLAVVKARGWRPDGWSDAERRWRAVIAVALGLLAAAGGFFVVGFGAWLLGPDCGATPNAATRLHILVLGVVVAVSGSLMPVALAGRRRVALLAAAAPVVVPLLAAVGAATSNDPGWCLF